MACIVVDWGGNTIIISLLLREDVRSTWQWASHDQWIPHNRLIKSNTHEVKQKWKKSGKVSWYVVATRHANGMIEKRCTHKVEHLVATQRWWSMDHDPNIKKIALSSKWLFKLLTAPINNYYVINIASIPLVQVEWKQDDLYFWSSGMKVKQDFLSFGSFVAKK
jgi:hypothetical protein